MTEFGWTLPFRTPMTWIDDKVWMSDQAAILAGLEFNLEKICPSVAAILSIFML